MKTDDYAAVYELNRHFDQIVEGIDRLQKGRLLPADSAEARKAALEEIRARTNFAVAQALESREAEDLCRFEDLRIAAVRKETGGNQLR